MRLHIVFSPIVMVMWVPRANDAREGAFHLKLVVLLVCVVGTVHWDHLKSEHQLWHN